MVSKPNNFSPALLIIDLQNDFSPPDGSLAVSEGRDTIPVVNELLSRPAFIARVATKDYHPQDHISFASNHTTPNNVPFTSFATVVNPENATESYETRLWPDHCVQGTPGSDLVDGLDMNLVDRVIEKGKDSRVEMYSAFYDPFVHPRISDSGLSKVLREEYKATWVYVVGLALDYCVKASALDAKKEGFEVVVIREGTRAVDGSDVNVATVEKELTDAGVRVRDLGSEEVSWLS
ncbi:Isochorismatase-like protein [Flagelloscypha sp. PMI_526]|nr:Isochorismatase-like protein [Flagelloscypha sp. PMI_526]